MNDFTVTLLSDGSADRALIPVVRWVLREIKGLVPARIEMADLRRLPSPPKALQDKIIKAIEFYPCNLILIHRDAETQSSEVRYREIASALDQIASDGTRLPYICIVPIRMHEAWLLFDIKAIRNASGNPNGKVRLKLPNLRTLERLPDPKSVLYELIESASELTGRRKKKLKLAKCASRVADNISDFSPLRRLSAFTRLERDVRAIVFQP